MKFTNFHKSTRSGVGENCLFKGEARDTDGTLAKVGFYDSKQQGKERVIIGVAPAAWTAFVNSVRA
ncbi:DUF397 domain-containing protein [Streptomyces sp. MH60]|uniref:DUF397 domain-containing protein n=1 Tax=Streptomyces sp. MH60 TaxID=1940758 RepID=UPI000CEE433E|nr:DUF397 domain-containing protein [Streptomyces sp. MH60]PPS89569.1 hypothetical protein BZZ08_01716 [Streptomyces sp. MH60]